MKCLVFINLLEIGEMVEAVGEVLVVEQGVQDVHGQEHRSYIQHLQGNADLAYFVT
jgi:hypothetical protein